MTGEPMNTMLQGEHLEAFHKVIALIKKEANVLHKSLVNFDIRVRKWASPPAEAIKTSENTNQHQLKFLF